jgi:hypothetical protein
MKRQQFILNISLISAASLLFPSLLFSKNQRVLRKVHIPLGGEHIRHGIYNPKRIRSQNLPNWFEVFEREILLSNGHSAGPNDLGVINFKINGRTLSIFQKGQGFSLLNESESLELNALNPLRNIPTKTGNIQILPVGKTKVHSKHESIGICLKGRAHIDSENVTEFECFSLSGDLDINVLHDSILILIQKT